MHIHKYRTKILSFSFIKYVFIKLDKDIFELSISFLTVKKALALSTMLEKQLKNGKIIETNIGSRLILGTHHDERVKQQFR